MAEGMDEVRLVKTLLDMPLFEDLDYAQISSILATCKQLEVEPGDVLCEPRSIDERLLILLDGKLRLESAQGERLSEMVPVRVIGEMGVFTGQTRGSRVVAQTKATVLALDATNLDELLEEDPHLGSHMMVSLIKMLYTRVHDMNEELVVVQQMRDRLRSRLEEVAPGDPLLGELFPEGPLDIQD